MKTYSYRVTSFFRQMKKNESFSEEEIFTSENLLEARQEAIQYHQKKLSEFTSGDYGEFSHPRNVNPEAVFSLGLHFVASENEEEEYYYTFTEPDELEETLEIEANIYKQLG